MNEAVTVEQLINEMKFGTEFIFALLLAVCLGLVIGEMRRARESHRIWKDLRKLEKEKLEKELETSKKDENGSVMILTPDDPFHGSKLISVSMLKERLQTLYDEDDNVEWCNAIAQVVHILDNEF